MENYCTVAWACLCFCLLSIVSCFKHHHNMYNAFHQQHNRRPSIHERLELDNSYNHRPHIRSSGYSDEVEEDWLPEGKPLVSGVLVEDEDDLSLIENRFERQASTDQYPDYGFYDETKKMLLDLHNLYRSNVTPPAANMAHMEWDDELAYYAQLWADACVFEHGYPPNTEYHKGLYGQNLYLGHDPSGFNAMWLWYAEFQHYNMRTLYCKPKEQCGHYVQMAWSDSDRLGCGMRKCSGRYLIVCHYFGPSIVGGTMYAIGAPCSQCPDEERGSLCRNNLCFSWDQCARLPHLCAEASCVLYCHNCGRLNSESCSCECADGFDSRDCSQPCTNKHAKCGYNPGFYDTSTCSLGEYSVQNKWCRKMCGKCNGVEPGGNHKFSCCDGKVCEDGSVLDFDGKVCTCKLLCPGPKCSGYCLRSTTLYLVILLSILYLLKTQQTFAAYI